MPGTDQGLPHPGGAGLFVMYAVGIRLAEIGQRISKLVESRRNGQAQLIQPVLTDRRSAAVVVVLDIKLSGSYALKCAKGTAFRRAALRRMLYSPSAAKYLAAVPSSPSARRTAFNIL